jgi:hypothetical protein
MGFLFLLETPPAQMLASELSCVDWWSGSDLVMSFASVIMLLLCVPQPCALLHACSVACISGRLHVLLLEVSAAVFTPT